MTDDPINPKHYVNASGKQLQDYIRDLPFGYGNAIKYIVRAGRKPGTSLVQDLEKAGWYLRDAKANIQPSPGATVIADHIRREAVDRAAEMIGDSDAKYTAKLLALAHLLLSITPGLDAACRHHYLKSCINMLQVLALRYFGDGEESDAT